MGTINYIKLFVQFPGQTPIKIFAVKMKYLAFLWLEHSLRKVNASEEYILGWLCGSSKEEKKQLTRIFIGPRSDHSLRLSVTN